MHTTTRRPRSDHPSTTAPPRRRPRLVAAAALLIVGACSALGSGATATAAELAFPFHTDFDSADGGTLSGDATIDDGWLRLTSADQSEAGSWLTDDVFPSDLGLEIEFRYAMHGGTGADGLLMSLSDGSVAPGVGRPGASLGYTCYDDTGQYGMCDVPGMPGAFVGLGFDRYGNFSRTMNESGGPGKVEQVVLRGSGNGTDGYHFLDEAPALGGTVETGSRAQARTVQVTVEPNADGTLAMTVRSDTGPGTRMRTVLDGVDLQGPGQAALPPTLRLGFSASTGSFTNIHEIDDLTVSIPTNLRVTQSMPDPVTAGTRVTATTVVSNVGRNGADGSGVRITVPPELENVRWTCTASTGAACGAGSGTGNAVATTADLPPGTSVTYTIDGDLRPAATGQIASVADVVPPANRTDTDESDNVSTIRAGVVAKADLATGKQVVLDDGATSIAPGGTFTYRITAENRGPSTATRVGATDDLPSAVTFVDSTDDCTADGRHVRCTSDAAVAPGESHGFSFRAELAADYRGDGSDVVNIAVATSPDDADGGDPSDPVRLVVDGGEPPAPTVTPTPTPGDGSGGADPSDEGSPHGEAGASGPAGHGTSSGSGPNRLAFTGSVGTALLLAIGAAGVVGGVVLVVARRRSRRSDVDDVLGEDDLGIMSGSGLD
ncbi:lectin-like domain-containing protein [Curtobacterium sp. RRHDQ10]|uniref:lectin-like domain-containing protein n=1 Tax=Curtobacterium phyllosphaerae TaxID=3413379 RepID=UPI003BF1E259